ncbi:MAG: molybdopterin biosynthesis protein [Desulfovibrionaceae bacterium]|nr:molybdopterin biosynthesis protein [Desulfovibrionaceae bacterium]MBF0515049.1 molybdopterin biosynthesis protein [Desulfovibrionaceae bacterium]
MQRTIYLNTMALRDSVALLKTRLDREALVGMQTVPATDAAGRITAKPVYAASSSPTAHCAAMDGIAVLASHTFAARENEPARLTPGKDFAFVNTGDVLPAGFDAVVMIEDVVFENGSALVEVATPPWRHVRRIGEDIVATELLLPERRRLTPFDIAALLACGVYDVAVYEQVRISVIPTGDEVVDPETRPVPGPGQVIESNSAMLAALAAEWGALVTRLAPVADDPALLEAAVEAALASDAHIVVLGAGSSAGAKDYSKSVMEKFGRVFVHGVSAMPGKPSILGVARGKLMVCAPGYPVSAMVCFEELVKPLAAWLCRSEPRERPTATAVMARDVPSKLGLEEFLRAAVGRVGERLVAVPLARGAGLITSLTKAQGLVRIPANAEGVKKGEQVSATLLCDPGELAATLIHVGSHDNILDLLASFLMRAVTPYRLASSHVGSMGGLAALADGSALFAGIHLFDPASGDYNFPFLGKYAADRPVAVINLVIRHQGLILAKGNPKNITGVADLARSGVRFVNRQRGAGTRILFDWHMAKAGLAPDRVAGYDFEEFTHMAVAVNVQSGAADCGMGIHAAARALGLDFIPVARERYDLAIPEAYLDDPRIAAMLAIIADPAFKSRVAELGGYETTLSGKRMRPGEALPG